MSELLDVKGRVINLLAVVHGATFSEGPTRISTGLGIVSAVDKAAGKVKIHWRAWHGPRIICWMDPSELRVMADRTIEEMMVHQEADIRALALEFFNKK